MTAATTYYKLNPVDLNLLVNTGTIINDEPRCGVLSLDGDSNSYTVRLDVRGTEGGSGAVSFWQGPDMNTGIAEYNKTRSLINRGEYKGLVCNINGSVDFNLDCDEQ